MPGVPVAVGLHLLQLLSPVPGTTQCNPSSWYLHGLYSSVAIPHTSPFGSHDDGRRSNAPLSLLKEVHVLISGACEMVSYVAKGLSRWDYVKDLVMGRFSWIILVNPMESPGSL